MLIIICACKLRVILLSTYTYVNACREGVSASRVYAISRRNWYLATITFGLGLVPVGTNLVSPSHCISCPVPADMISQFRFTRLTIVLLDLPSSVLCYGDIHTAPALDNKYASVLRKLTRR